MRQGIIAASAIVVFALAGTARADPVAARNLAVEAARYALHGDRGAAVVFLERAYYAEPTLEYLQLLVEQCEQFALEEDDPLPLSLAVAHLHSYLRSEPANGRLEFAQRSLKEISSRLEHWDWGHSLRDHGSLRGLTPVPIGFAAEPGANFYINVAGQTCDTPCTLRLTPGAHHLSAWGADDINYDLVIPRIPGYVILRASANRYYAPGVALTVLGPLVAASLWALAEACPQNDSFSACSTANIIVWPIVGAGMLFTGIGLLAYRATHLVNDITVETVATTPISSDYLPHPKLQSIGMMPTPGGASAGVAAVF